MPSGLGLRASNRASTGRLCLRDTVTHNHGAYSAIIGESIAREAEGVSIIYYTWTRYWISGILVPGENVEWLEEPETSLPDGQSGNTEFDGQNLGWAVNELRILASTEFLDANPAAEKLFELAEIEINDVSAQNNRMQQGEGSIEDIDSDVDDWIVANQDAYDSWIAEARSVTE
ncbi:MAG: glycine betaine ABC transporter substrate-binding protein [Sulfitobacter sp.]